MRTTYALDRVFTKIRQWNACVNYVEVIYTRSTADGKFNVCVARFLLDHYTYNFRCILLKHFASTIIPVKMYITRICTSVADDFPVVLFFLSIFETFVFDTGKRCL